MTRLYKLTDAAGRTRNNTQWGPGVTHSGTGTGDLCSEGWIHAYTHPLLAVLLNPIHANFAEPRLWEAEGDVALDDRGLKVGCKTLTTLREAPVPAVTLEQRVRFGILCARKVCADPTWLTWAERWLSGEDRSKENARVAAVVIAAHAIDEGSCAAAMAADAGYAYDRYARVAVAHLAAEIAFRVSPLNLTALAEESCA